MELVVGLGIFVILFYGAHLINKILNEQSAARIASRNDEKDQTNTSTTNPDKNSNSQQQLGRSGSSNALVSDMDEVRISGSSGH